MAGTPGHHGVIEILGRARRAARESAWGLALTAAGVAAAYALGLLLPTVSPLTLAVALGAVVGNVPGSLRRSQAGLDVATHHLLRLGIVLLGLRLAVTDVVDLGLPSLAVVVAVVTVTFFGTQWLGRRLGLSPGASLLVATGFSICGASAVAAMDGVTRNRKEDTATAIALVTVFGSLAIVVLPALQGPLGLSDQAFGAWAGASVHDVAQTVAAAGAAGPSALAAAVVVKLTRVVLLAPMVAGVGLWERRRDAGADGGTRPPLVPLFVVGFLVAVAVRSTGVVPAGVLVSAEELSTLLLAAALFALGTAVRFRRLARTGGRALALGLLSWVTICVVAYVGVRLVSVG